MGLLRRESVTFLSSNGNRIGKEYDYCTRGPSCLNL